MAKEISSLDQPEKLRVAIIIPGGIGTGARNIGVPVLEKIVLGLAKNFDVTVFSLFKVNADYSPVNFKIISIPQRNPILKTLHFFWSFIKHHRKSKFHIVHGFWALPSGLFAMLIGKIFKIKSIVSILGGDAISLPEIHYGQLNNFISRRLIIFSLEQADEMISTTKYMVTNLRRHGLEREDIKIIPWGVDVNDFNFNNNPIEIPVKFLHIANLAPVKDQITLIRTFKIINDAIPSHLTIIGEGPSEAMIIELIEQLQLTNSVIIEKQIPYNDIPKTYLRADVLLQTSLSEGQGMVFVEAMSAGLLVSGTSAGMLSDFPLLCVSAPPRDYQMLAKKILVVLKNPALIHEIKSDALDWSRAHSMDWTIREIGHVYNSIL